MQRRPPPRSRSLRSSARLPPKARRAGETRRRGTRTSSLVPCGGSHSAARRRRRRRRLSRSPSWRHPGRARRDRPGSAWGRRSRRGGDRLSTSFRRAHPTRAPRCGTGTPGQAGAARRTPQPASPQKPGRAKERRCAGRPPAPSAGRPRSRRFGTDRRRARRVPFRARRTWARHLRVRVRPPVRPSK